MTRHRGGARQLGRLFAVMNTATLGVMNTDRFVRTTFVLDRETSARLSFIARRVGRSRSELVRELLAEPVVMLQRVAATLPEPSAEPSRVLTANERQLILEGLDTLHNEAEALLTTAREGTKAMRDKPAARTPDPKPRRSRN